MSDPTPVRVFLDANVLYAACLSPAGGSAKLWAVPALELVTSEYALREAWENLSYQSDADALRERLCALTSGIQIIPHDPGEPRVPRSWTLPDPSDVPILEGAIASHCVVLVTLDAACFGAFFGKELEGVTILKPGRLLDRLGR
jgi:uncharacterized protein